MGEIAKVNALYRKKQAIVVLKVDHDTKKITVRNVDNETDTWEIDFDVFSKTYEEFEK